MNMYFQMVKDTSVLLQLLLKHVGKKVMDIDTMT